MTFRQFVNQFAWMMLWAALPLSAGTIDVSGAATALLGSGDTLAFGIPSWNYGMNAARNGLPVYPTDVSFIFVSAAANAGALFDASLQTADGSISETFGTGLAFGPGAYSGSNYSGPVSTLEASVHLSAAMSQLIFGGSQAVLILRNAGPAITLWLPPNKLQQDLFVSLAGGDGSGEQISGALLSVGALHGSVTLHELVAPEPHSGILLMIGAAFLCLLARRLSPKQSQINRLQSRWTL
jgi:hypothetical protein